MKVGIKIGERGRQVEIAKHDGRLHFLLNGKSISVDAIEVAPQIYSILLGSAAFEVRVEPKDDGLRVYTDGHEYFTEIIDPRRFRRSSAKGAQAEGRQEIVAPMPGKIVRVLVKTGEVVEAGQGLLVVEAMKMQNEIKSPKSGKIDRLLVREGQAVNSGENLAVVV
ncbi:MAG TPA: biotin/lipoyl-containing protein [Candidatus Acidoferrales bacterium]|nr:biotin/lipoyl-containing protein [Candidatus Acidoferrales bacterium]